MRLHAPARGSWSQAISLKAKYKSQVAEEKKAAAEVEQKVAALAGWCMACMQLWVHARQLLVHAALYLHTASSCVLGCVLGPSACLRLYAAAGHLFRLDRWRVAVK